MRMYLMHKFKIIILTLISVFVVALSVWWLQPEPSITEAIPVSENAKEPVPDFSQYTKVIDKKSAFFDYLRPAVEAQNDYIVKLRQLVQGFRAKEISGEQLSEKQLEELSFLLKEYRIKKNVPREDMYARLIRKIDIIPLELVLVQTANESAWGTSRFARQGYNFFGLWCFRTGCGFVPSRRNSGASHEVAKFEDLSSAMYEYMRTLNSHPAYTDMRLIREKQRINQQAITANALAEGLTKYSERGQEYVDELRHMIRINKDLISS